MLPFIISLGFAGLTAASPLLRSPSDCPPIDASKGFNLVINVTDLSADFTPSIHHTFVSSIHVGAGLNLVGNTATPKYARLFYQNSTTEEQQSEKSRLVSDGGQPAAPAGLSLALDAGSKTLSTARLDYGQGTEGLSITRSPAPYALLSPGNWVACMEKVEYYPGTEMLLIKQTLPTIDADGKLDNNIPQGCAPINLIPQCHELNKLEKGDIASHEFAFETGCYKSVSAIDWTKYIAP